MTSEEEKKFLQETKEVLARSERGLADHAALKEAIEFALNEWQTNKHWFREEPGRVTVPDVIKTCIEFGWASKNNFNHKWEREHGHA